MFHSLKPRILGLLNHCFIMDFQELLHIIEKLRGPEGCPWDKVQSRESLKQYIIEEAYELIEAIEENNLDQIREELGDLLFQIVFQCQIAKENNEFTISDVIREIVSKMVGRHPHVFGNSECRTPEEIIKQWEVLKKHEGKLRDSILEGVPRAMSSLLRAHRLQKRAAQVGFDWEKAEDVLGKVDEEMHELKEALRSKRKEDIEDELGDIFFMLVNLARFVGVNPEDAHRKTISKFIRRFRHIETRAAEQGRQLSEMTLEEMDTLWDESKKRE